MPYRPLARAPIPIPIPVPAPPLRRNASHPSSHTSGPLTNVGTRILSPSRFISRSPEPLFAVHASETALAAQTPGYVLMGDSGPSPLRGVVNQPTRPVRRQLATHSAPPRRPFIAVTSASQDSGSQNETSTDGATTDTESDSERPVVIPPLFDEVHEEEVRRVLSRYGINAVSSPARTDGQISRTMLRSASTWSPHASSFSMSRNTESSIEWDRLERSSSTNTDGSLPEDIVQPPAHLDTSASTIIDGDVNGHTGAEDTMEIDELVELECSPSRPASPSLALENPHEAEQPVPSTSTTTASRPVAPTTVAQASASEAVVDAATSSAARTRRRGTRNRRPVDMDIAGVCFDPKGQYIYVATTDAVFEWELKDADTRWFASGAWA